MIPLLREIGRGALDLLFAPICVACEAPIPAGPHRVLICQRCWSRSQPIPRPRCDRCWSPVAVLPGDDPLARCTLCAELPPSLRAIRSAFLMNGPPREIVHALKYSGWYAAAGEMGRAMASLPFPQEVVEEVRLVVPVPLSRPRLRERGYNQAAVLAEAFASERGWRAAPELLVRTRATERQTTLHPAERRANVARAFSAPLPPRIRRQHVLLVDDVWTTGATALACAEALLEAGARAVSVITFGRALPELERQSALGAESDEFLERETG